MKIRVLLTISLLIFATAVFSQNQDFDFAIKNGNLALFEKQILRGADIKSSDIDGNFIIYKIIKEESISTNIKIKLIDIAVKHGADINVHNNNDKAINSPLSLAIAYCDVDLVNACIKFKAEINDSISGWTPLCDAAQEYQRNPKIYFQIIELLIANGADINLKNRLNGETPLLAISGNVDDQYLFLIQYFLEKGSNCDVYDFLKNSPLLNFMERWNDRSAKDIIKNEKIIIKIVELMIKNNAQPSHINDSKLSAIDIVENKISTSKSIKEKNIYKKILLLMNATSNESLK
jgi:ankyrin repeat protein